MVPDEDPTDPKRSDPQFRQTALSNVTARDVQIGQLVQKIVYLGLPFNSRFAQLLANSAYLTCLLGGFMRLWRDGADWTTLLLLFGGGGLLSLTCLYYVWFWKPAVEEQRIRQLALVGVLAIPLLTVAGFLLWRSLPPPNALLLVANFANTHNADNRDDLQVTEYILRNLRSAIEPYKDVKLQALNQPITEQQGSEVARAEGERRKATIVLWGDYAPTATNAGVSVHFELLKPPPDFPELGAAAKGQAQTAAIAELNSFKLQTRLSQEMSYLTLFTLGMVHYTNADWDGAVKRFGDALAQVKEPVPALSQAVVYFYRAISYADQGKDNEAIADFSHALKLKPDDDLAYYNRGLSYEQQNKDEEAIADYNQALKLQPDFAYAYNNRGTAYANQGKDKEAIADFNQALKLKPDLVSVYYNRGTVYNHQGKDEEAIADFNQALKLKPDFTEAYYARGKEHANQGKDDAAIADYNQSLKLKPDFAEAYNNRGTAYNHQGKDDEAIADFNQVLKLKSDDAYAYNNRGTAYANQSKDEEAIADFNQALKLKPDYANAYYNRGTAYAHQSKYDEAFTDFNYALKLKPNFAGAYFNMARIYSLERKNKEAIESLQRAIQLDTQAREAAKKDSNFNNIRHDKQFQALVGE